MEKIERYVEEVCRRLGGPREMRLHVRQELREHLLDAVEDLRAGGMNEEEAVAKALEDFGATGGSALRSGGNAWTSIDGGDCRKGYAMEGENDESAMALDDGGARCNRCCDFAGSGVCVWAVDFCSA